MKKLITLFMLVSVCLVASPPEFPRQFPVYKDSTGTTILVGEKTPLPVQILGSGGISLASSPMYVIPVGPNSATATFDIILPAVAYATRSAVILATNSVTLLKNIASFTNGDILYFQGRSKFYWSQSSNPTATATTMQILAHSAESGDMVGPFRLKTTCDFAFVADSTGVCSLTYTLAREQ